MAVLDELVRDFTVAVQSFRLDVRRARTARDPPLIRLDSEVSKALFDILDILRLVASGIAVGILQPRKKLPPLFPCEQPVINSRAQIPYVWRTGRTGSITDADRHE